MAPSLLLSLNLNRKVPGHLLLSRAFSLSLLMKPMMELHAGRKPHHSLWTSTEHVALTRNLGVAHPSFHRDSRCLLITSRIPSIHNQKGKAFSLALCCRAEEKTFSNTAVQRPPSKLELSRRLTVAHLAELGPGDEPLRVPLGFASCRENQTVTSWIVPDEQLAGRRPFTLNCFCCVAVRTEQFVGQHVELLLVQASLGDGGELPAQNL